MEAGKPPKEAAIAAMDELLRPIIAITLVLLCVFLPASILPGIVGQLYRQFALVIAATAFISAINAVTLKPTQCAQWLRPRDGTTERLLPPVQPRATGTWNPAMRGSSGTWWDGRSCRPWALSSSSRWRSGR